MKKSLNKDNETNEYKAIKKEYSNNIEKILSDNKCLNPYLVTVRPKFIPINNQSLDATQKEYRFFTNVTWTQNSRLYRHLISKLTNNFQKKSYLHPRTYDFFDVDNTRNTQFATFSKNTIPHIHSIYLVHIDTDDKFKSLMNDNFECIMKHPSIEPYFKAMHAKPITDNIEKAVSYCSKFYDNFYARQIRNNYQLFNQHPILNSEKSPQLSKEEKEERAEYFKKIDELRNLYIR